MKLLTQLLWGALLLTLILLVETYSNIDPWLQNHFYDFSRHEWLINKELHQSLSIIFYKGIKNLVIATGVISLLYFIASFVKSQTFTQRKASLLLFLSIVFVPVIVAGSKQITNVYCPDQLEMYGGQYPFVRVLENYPADFQQIKRGKCFPAGHSTVGFSLMMLYFCFQKKWQKRVAIITTLTLGWTTGFYQMLRGEHFLSHTLFSMVASWLVILLIYHIVNKYFSNRLKNNFG